MPERRRSIRAQLSVLLAVMVIPGIGVLAHSQYKSVQSSLSRENAHLWSTAEAASMGIGEFLSNSERILERLAQDPDVRSLDPERCPVHLSAMKDLFGPTYTNLFTWTQDGEEICSALDPTETPSGLGTPPGLEDIKAAEGFHISLVHIGTSTQRWTTGLSYPIRGEEGRKVGTITLSVDLIHFQEILSELSAPMDGVVTIMEIDRGTIVARSRDSEEYVGKTAPTPSGNPSRDDPDYQPIGNSRSRNMAGEEFYWGFVEIQDTPWKVWVGRPYDTVYDPLKERWIRSGFLTLGVILLFLFLGRTLYSRIANPLAELARETATANPGDSHPLTVQGPREVAQVAARFNEAWGAWREAEAEKRLSMERTRSLVENAVTGIYISTEGGQFLEVNHAMVELLGYESREALMSTPVSSLYNSNEERLETLAKHGRKEFFQGVEVHWRRKDGSPLTVRLFGRRFMSPTGEASWEVIVEDITKMRNLQEQYLQAQKMEALGRLAGGIAHDFNNLLTVVQGQAELILDDPSVGEALKSQVREISGAASRGSDLNRQLLSFGRRGKVFAEAVDLNSILIGFELVLRRAVGEEINLEFALGHDLGWIRGDRGQLEQVIMNLVVNARDAMPKGGSLLVQTYNEELDEEEAEAYPSAAPGPKVVMAIKDTGTGIDPTLLASIFEPFFTTKPQTKGTGLGLATVYGIVTDLGGYLKVDSILGEGTTFRLFFPVSATPKPEVAPLIPEPTTRPGSGMILLAEDEDAVRRLTTRILERAGYEVLVATDGKNALEMARAHEGQIDLLLTDVIMPNIRGPELAEILAQEGRVTRVVLFSGYPEGMRDTGVKGLETWEFLPKPFSSRDLLAAVQRALDVDA
jgi:PAS domain S-box-containing protein